MELLKFFQKNSNGSWTCIKPVQIKGPTGEINIGHNVHFNKGVYFMGLDIVAMLEKEAAKVTSR